MTIISMQAGIVPPTINYEYPDDACDLNLVVNRYKEAEINYALKNSLGFGGHNASVVVKRWTE